MWEDGSTYRGEVKKLARIVASSHYPLDPPSTIRTHKERSQWIKDAVETLRKDGEFMKNGLDDEVQHYST